MFESFVSSLGVYLTRKTGLKILSYLMAFVFALGCEFYSLFDYTFKKQHLYKYSTEWSDTVENNTVTDWFHDAKYGIFVHYLYTEQTQFDSFDANAFAEAVSGTGAKYVVMTLGQNSGYYCSPNATYENYIGVPAGTYCSTRDIPMEVADALAQYSIRLMLYLPSQGPSAAGDEIPKALGATQRHDETNWMINETMAQRWADVIREWAVRYGQKVSGWWFDGFYECTGYTGDMADYVGKLYKEACRAVNSGSIVAFNGGVFNGIITPATADCDYTAGEENSFEYYPSARFYAGAQWHILSYLGQWWGNGELKYDSGYLAEYAKKVFALGGVITFEIHIEPDGSFSKAQTDELTRVRDAIDE